MSELRVVLLGKTGSGKSSLGNTLLGREAFRVARGMSSGTEKCQWADADHFGMILQVTDTPGLCDTHRDEEDVLREVGKSVAVASPGPHVILMVLRCDKRFTEEEYNAYRTLKKLFGPEIKDHMIVVFSGADCYDATLEQQQQKLKADLVKCPSQLDEVLSDANRRYMGVSNVATRHERDLQTQKLLQTMQELVSANGGKYFSNNLCEKINNLVGPLVEQRMQGDTPRAEAVRSTNLAIVDENVVPGFLDKLKCTLQQAILPIAVENAEIAAVTAVTYVLSRCSLM